MSRYIVETQSQMTQLSRVSVSKSLVSWFRSSGELFKLITISICPTGREWNAVICSAGHLPFRPKQTPLGFKVMVHWNKRLISVAIHKFQSYFLAYHNLEPFQEQHTYY